MRGKRWGFSMIEMIVVLAILSILSIPLIRILKVSFDYWRTGSEGLKSSMDVHYLLSELIDELNQIQSISVISDYNNQEAFIQYRNVSGNEYTIFLNSEVNQTFFDIENSYSKNSILFLNDVGQISPLIYNVNTFVFETFSEVAELIQVVTANNIGAIEYDEINSVRFRITTQINNTVESLEQLVDIARDPLQFTGVITYGATENLLIEYEENGYILENTEIVLDDSGVAFLALKERSETVRILNTGDYFLSITAALNAAVSGDIVLVGYKEDPYVENIIIPEGVTLRGGYDPVTWVLDPAGRKTQLVSQSGVLLEQGTVFMNSNTEISGFSIGGENLLYAVLALNQDNVSILNNEIFDADNPIYLEGVEGAQVYGNSVTSNQYALYMNSVTDANVERNRFNSNNALLKENVILLNANRITFVNNLVSNGYYCLKAESSSNVSILNNIFFNAQNFSVLIKNLIGSQFRNNAVVQNNIGISIIETEVGVFTGADVQYNFFLNNTYGDTLDFALDITNIQDNLSDFEMNFANPYFVDLVDFLLVNTSPLIDVGDPADEYDDVYTLSNPAKGTVRNDIGLYGGPKAGRVGYPMVISLDLFNTGTASNLIRDSFPGDIFIVDQGEYEMDISISLKPYQIFTGEGTFTTELLNISGETLFELADYSMLANFSIDSAINPAIEISVADFASVQNVFFHNDDASILIKEGLGNIKFNTFHSVDFPVIVQNDANLEFDFNVVNDAVFGISNQGSLTVQSQYNVFTSVDTLYSGFVDFDNDLQQEQDVFWDLNSAIFILNPTSNAIEVNGRYDAGALGFYEDFGSITFSQISANVDRLYTEINFEYLLVDDKKYAVSAIYVEFIDDESLYLDEYIIIDTETVTSNRLVLPNNVISDSLYLKLHFYSYTFNHTPIVDTISLSW